jgi:hypothetical protein
MTEEKDKELKVVFAPGSFDHFEGTQEELDALQKEIMEMFEGKTREEIEAMATPLDELDFEDLPEGIQRQLMADFEDPEERNKRLN